MAYIDARAVQERLDTVCGPEGWQDEYRPTQGGFICRLSIRCGEDWIAKEDGTDVSAIEPTKGGVSDRFKSKSAVLQQTPYLPTWAVPMNEAKRQRFLAKCAALSSRLGNRYARILEQQGPRTWGFT